MTTDPAVAAAALWDHDRRILSNWLMREAGSGFDGAQIRPDGSSYVSVPSGIGQLSVHDYWSFIRKDFDQQNRIQGYADALRRQVPILSIGYIKPDGQSAQTVAFLVGEIDTTSAAGISFAPFSDGRVAGSLVCVETAADGSQSATNLYADSFLYRVLSAARQIASAPPVQPT